MRPLYLKTKSGKLILVAIDFKSHVVSLIPLEQQETNQHSTIYKVFNQITDDTISKYKEQIDSLMPTIQMASNSATLLYYLASKADKHEAIYDDLFSHGMVCAVYKEDKLNRNDISVPVWRHLYVSKVGSYMNRTSNVRVAEYEAIHSGKNKKCAEFLGHELGHKADTLFFLIMKVPEKTKIEEYEQVFTTLIGLAANGIAMPVLSERNIDKGAILDMRVVYMDSKMHGCKGRDANSHLCMSDLSKMCKRLGIEQDKLDFIDSFAKTCLLGPIGFLIKQTKSDADKTIIKSRNIHALVSSCLEAFKKTATHRSQLIKSVFDDCSYQTTDSPISDFIILD